jgi:hypothetical protein
MKIDGERKKGAQLLTVGTLPEFRQKGIQKEIWKRASRWISDTCDFVFLFTDDLAAGFYEKLGLRRQVEFSEIISCSVTPRKPSGYFRRLDLEEKSDYANVARLAKEREMVSERIGFYNPNLLLFMFLYCYRDFSYYLKDIDTVVVVEEKEERIRVHAVVAKKTPSLEQLMPFFSHFERKEIEFLFCTDRLGINNVTREEVTESLLFVNEDFHLEGKFMFPSSIRA